MGGIAASCNCTSVPNGTVANAGGGGSGGYAKSASVTVTPGETLLISVGMAGQASAIQRQDLTVLVTSNPGSQGTSAFVYQSSGLCLASNGSGGAGGIAVTGDTKINGNFEKI
jgi:hypothetical protein